MLTPNSDPMRYDGKAIKISAQRLTLIRARDYFENNENLNIPNFNKIN